MIKKCDHTSVGALIYNERGQLLMFKRGTPPVGVAGPAGHCDGDTYLLALRKEVWEEVGLQVVSSQLVASFRVEKACRRPYDGVAHHIWQFYTAKVTGTIVASERETDNDVRWYGVEEIKRLIQRTKEYHLLGRISDEAYWAQPGLDLSWYYLFTGNPGLLRHTAATLNGMWSEIEEPSRGRRGR